MQAYAIAVEREKLMENYIKSMIFMLVILVVLLRQAIVGIMGKESRKRYIHLVIMTMAYVFTDSCFIICHYAASDFPSFVFKTAAFVFYVVYVCLPYVWHKYVRNYVGLSFNKYFIALEKIPLLFQLILIVISIPTGILWGITEECVYVRGSLFTLFSIVNLFYYVEPLADLVVIVAGKTQKKERYIFQAVLISAIPLFAVIANTYVIPVYDIYPFQPFCSVIVALLAFFFMAEQETRAFQKENEQVITNALNTAEEATKEAQAAGNVKTEFLLRMSHDIRTPLNGIIGMLEIAEKYPDDLNKQSECRKKVKESSKVLLELINEVLDMSKLESGEIVLENVPFDLNDVINDTEMMFKTRAEENNIKFSLDASGVTHKKLIGSTVHYKRIIMNVVGNAIKYNKEKGFVKIVFSECDYDGKVSKIKFVCEDGGMGMSTEFLKLIFEPFAQENSDARSKYGGTGLGMPIAKSLTEKMGGEINVTSTKNKGTRFEVVIPFETDENFKEHKAKNKETQTASIEGLNILLAEDNELNMEIAKFRLEEEGAIITEAFNGEEAAEKFKKSAPYEFDVILMDVMMPVKDGYAATREIRALDRADAHDVIIIAMTANAFAEDKIKSLDAGMNAHISKPIDMELLINTIAGMTEKNGKK